MKERPILFSGSMVRALLDGSKTQTRRVVPDRILEKYSDYDDWCNAVMPSDIPCSRVYEKESFKDQCKYGFPGDRLWVRETWAQNQNQTSDTYMDTSYVYRADGEERAVDNGVEKPWRPSIHMPRSASRITLEITDVRVERLQDISEQDAIAEGIECNPRLDPCGRCHWRVYGKESTGTNLPESSYESLWKLINGAESWDANPWVWVIEFKRVNP